MMSNECLTINVEEAGRQLGIGRNQAYEAVRRGEIPSIRIGKRLLVPKAAFARLLGLIAHVDTTDLLSVERASVGSASEDG